MYKMAGSKANCGSVRKGSWTDEEDNLLRNCIDKHGEGNWHRVPFRAGLNRCRKSCRLRWMNYLKPNIKRGQFNEDEVDLIIRLHKLLGNRWSLIAGRIPGRTANDVKNYWNTHLLKKMCPNPKQPNNYNNNNVCSKTTRTSSSTTTTTTTTKEGSNTASGIIIKPHAWSFAKQYGGEGGRSSVVSKSSSSVIENSEEEEEQQQQQDDKWWEKLVDIYDEKKGKDDTNNNNNNYNINNNINNNNSSNNNDDDVQHILHTAYSSWDDHLLWNLDLNVWDS